MIHRWKHPTLKMHLLGLTQGIAGLIDNTLIILSLRFLSSGLALRTARYRAKVYIQELKLDE